MIDIQQPLREAIYSIITGLEFTCYEAGAIPDAAITPYVIIADISSNEKSNKTGFGNSVQTLLDIVTSYNKNIIGSSKLADSMANIILGHINSKTIININDTLQIVSTKVLQDRKLNAKSDTKRIYRRLIRFQHLIMEI